MIGHLLVLVRHFPGGAAGLELFRKLVANIHALDKLQAFADEIEHLVVGRPFKFELILDSSKLQADFRCAEFEEHAGLLVLVR
ncbi:MAG: hypothetical protein IH905_13120 [Proteobacteria bacterium]|nr:hypothetical protein [Pseudomonadota bacterium]